LSPSGRSSGRTSDRSEHEGAIVAVKPNKAFAQYFEEVDRLTRHRTERCGAEGGSDGTRTRDLWRDRPAL
jgi:hypothetical protein